jgi:hypothetical protein
LQIKRPFGNFMPDKMHARVWLSGDLPLILTVGGFTASEESHYAAAGFAIGSTEVAARSSATPMYLTQPAIAEIISGKTEVLKALPQEKNRYGYAVCELCWYAIEHGAFIPDDVPLVHKRRKFFSIEDLMQEIFQAKEIAFCNLSLITDYLDSDPEHIFFDGDQIDQIVDTFLYNDVQEYQAADKMGKPSSETSNFIKFMTSRFKAKGGNFQHQVKQIKVAEYYGQSFYRYCHIFKAANS